MAPAHQMARKLRRNLEIIVAPWLGPENIICVFAAESAAVRYAAWNIAEKCKISGYYAIVAGS